MFVTIQNKNIVMCLKIYNEKTSMKGFQVDNIRANPQQAVFETNSLFISKIPISTRVAPSNI